MTSTIKTLLQETEDRIAVPRHAEDVLTRRLFKRRFVFAPLFSVLAGASVFAAFLVMTHFSHTPLSAQNVLAETLDASTATTKGMITEITRTIQSSFVEHGEPQIKKVWTDGTRYLTGTVDAQGEAHYTDWAEKQADGTTLKEYSVSGDSQTIDENSEANAVMPDEELLGVASKDSPMSTTTVCEKQDGGQEKCNTTSVPDSSDDSSSILTAPTNDAPYYHITLTGDRFSFAVSEGKGATSLTRDFFVDPDTMKTIKRTWDATLPDGTHSIGEFDYVYNAIPVEALGHPFTLDWWKNIAEQRE